jgi:predicted homoserine dehydrogenase-like protein
MDPLKNDILIGIIGLGAMGKGLVYQTLITEGIKTAAVCDSDVGKACKILEEFNIEYIVADSGMNAEEIAAQGKTAVIAEGVKLTRMKGLDAVIEATGTIIEGGEYCAAALNAHKHLILMNSEVDLIFGPYFAKLAQQNGVICTSCDGDQYGVLKHLADDVASWGFELVMAGNMKGFLDRNANPTSIIPEADKRNLDYKACASYTDGTKLNIEMAITANALGLKTRVPGMYGPVCDDIDNVQQVFDFASLKQSGAPFVDYVLGAAPGGGIFVIGYCENPYQREMLKYYKMGNGPFYTFYRPYHLCHIEAMQTVFDAVQKNKALLQPDSGFMTNVYAYAKKDLASGDTLDGIGGYSCYGMIENCEDQNDAPGIPICLADRVSIKKSVKKGEKIYLSDVDYDKNRLDFRLFSLSGGLLL